MNILCLNTAFKKADIALSKDGKVFLKSFSAEARHSENLLVGVEEILNFSGLGLNELDVVAGVIGPGSFTGLRIGAATIKGFMTANKKLKAVNISSLQLLSAKYFELNPKENKVLALMNALSGRYFAAIYNADGSIDGEEKMIEKEEVKNYLCVTKNFCFNVEDENAFGKGGIDVSGETLLRLVNAKVKNKEFVDINEILPVYLRLSQAEEQRNKKNEN